MWLDVLNVAQRLFELFVQAVEPARVASSVRMELFGQLAIGPLDIILRTGRT